MRDEKEVLTEQTLTPNFWSDSKKARETNQKIEALQRVLEPFDRIESTIKDNKELVEISEGSDPMIAEVEAALPKLTEDLRKLELQKMLSHEADRLGAIISINAGSGGTEAQDWALMIQRMLYRYAHRKNFSVEIVDEQPGEVAGIKSCSFICRGPMAYGYFKSERGVHRLVRISPFDSNKRRHTSFAAVDVIPEIDDSFEIEIRPEDIKMDTYRSGGAGGQHVNKTESAVRLTHIPTGVIVACQTQRSQHQNRATAMNMLKSKLYEIELKKREAQMQAHHDTKMENAWGSQIRSYVLQPYRLVKDHRTDFESFQPDKILDGELEDFVEAYLLQGTGQEKKSATSTNIDDL